MELNFKALQDSHYCPPYKPDNFIETIELESFDCDIAKSLVRDSVALLSHSNSYRPFIIEILDVLNNNKGDFLINQHQYISFYWSGIPVLQLTMKIDSKHDKQLHISLQKYKTEKEKLIVEKKQDRFTKVSTGLALGIACVLAGITFVKLNNDKP